ncbi:hypothetical protein GCM10023189_48350 [Nibrella saemangeumensis]|uniref:Lipocalin-like domain-containing protein n=1 Tax=Nibrella saemangeumensis TaxID=1084526 RepID=A0ABP8NFA7_9BACT
MKKVSFFFFVLLLGVAFNGISQTTTLADFFAGKWEITVTGTPNGDAKFVTDLTRKDGKLTGELKDPTGKMTEAIPIEKIEEEANKITIYFSAQGYDVNIALEKATDDDLKGSLLGMFDATAKRVKE